MTWADTVPLSWFWGHQSIRICGKPRNPHFVCPNPCNRASCSNKSMEMRNKIKHVPVEPPTAVQLAPKLRYILYSTISMISRCYIERGQPKEPRGRARMSPKVNFKLTWATYRISLQHLGGAFGRFWALFLAQKSLDWENWWLICAPIIIPFMGAFLSFKWHHF